MNGIISLDDFTITRLHVDWHDNAVISADAYELGIEYDVGRNPENRHQFLLKFRVNYGTERGRGKRRKGYEVEAEIHGLFTFPDDTPEDEMQTLIRINGGTILYGILRGEIASFTGSFPAGKLILPTVYMHEIVSQVEAERLQTQQNSAVEKASLAKRTKPRTPKAKKK